VAYHNHRIPGRRFFHYLNSALATEKRCDGWSMAAKMLLSAVDARLSEREYSNSAAVNRQGNEGLGAAAEMLTNQSLP